MFLRTEFWCNDGLTAVILSLFTKEKLHFSFICSFYCCLVNEIWALKVAKQFANVGLVAYKKSKCILNNKDEIRWLDTITSRCFWKMQYLIGILRWCHTWDLLFMQFHWQFLIPNSGFWLVNILLRKLDTSSEKRTENKKNPHFSWLKTTKNCHKSAFFALNLPHWPVM